MSAAHLVLENFTPIIDSIEWKVGHRYWQVRGTGAFTSNEVPHLVTNDGVRAARAADVLFANCEAAAQAGALEDEIVVAELAVGLGMHARLLLDRFQARCQEAGRDWYGRLTFLATDWSSQTIADLIARGTLPAHHAARVRMGRIDAMNPGVFVAHETGEERPLSDLRAIFHNYLLAVLPFDLFVRQGERWLQVQVQSRIDDVQLASLCSEVPLDQLQTMLASGADEVLDKLVPLYELFCMERAFFPVDITQVPAHEELLRFAEEVVAPFMRAHPEAGPQLRLLHSYGAMQALRAMMPVVRDDGFVLFSDYGWTSLEDLLTVKQHQRFGPATAMGLNFCYLDEALPREGVRVHTPSDDDQASIRARLLTRSALPETEAAFQTGFATAPLNVSFALQEQARQAQVRGDVVTASARFAEAHRRFPESWHLLLEAARHATFYARNPQLGLELAERARQMNPTSSAQVYNEIGDALYELGRGAQAHQAYEQAIAVDPEHPRAWMNLAWTLSDSGRFGEAIEALGRAFARDVWGQYQGAIAEKQQQILKLRLDIERRKQGWFQARQR